MGLFFRTPPQTMKMCEYDCKKASSESLNLCDESIVPDHMACTHLDQLAVVSGAFEHMRRNILIDIVVVAVLPLHFGRKSLVDNLCHSFYGFWPIHDAVGDRLGDISGAATQEEGGRVATGRGC